MIKRAMVSGLMSTGHQHRRPPRAARAGQPPPDPHTGLRGGVPRRHERRRPRAARDPVLRAPGHSAHSAPREGGREALHALRAAAGRAGPDREDRLSGARPRELCRICSGTLEATRSWSADFRIVVDYGQSAASFVLPLVLGPLERGGGVGARVRRARHSRAEHSRSRSRRRSGSSRRSVLTWEPSSTGPASGSSSSAENGRGDPGESRRSSSFSSCLREPARKGSVAFPVTVTSHVDRHGRVAGLEVVRTPTSPAELMQAASGDGMVLLRAATARTSFPSFSPPSMRWLLSAACSSCWRRRRDGSLSSWRSCRRCTSSSRVPCSWALKGLVMRVLTERLKGREVDLRDGIKVIDNGALGHVRPDPSSRAPSHRRRRNAANLRASSSRSCCALVDEALSRGEPESQSQVEVDP